MHAVATATIPSLYFYRRERYLLTTHFDLDPLDGGGIGRLRRKPENAEVIELDRQQRGLHGLVEKPQRTGFLIVLAGIPLDHHS